MVGEPSSRVALATASRRIRSASTNMPLLFRASPSAACASARRRPSVVSPTQRAAASGRCCTCDHSSCVRSSYMGPVNRMWHVPHFCHALACVDALGFSLCSASLTRQATCAHPASPRRARPDWIGAKSSSQSRQMMQAPAGMPRRARLCALVASFALARALHTSLWPPAAFQ